MLCVGLTGNIGSGKTTAAHYFQMRGVPVIDADVIARELCTPHLPIYNAIVEKFGLDLVRNDGTLDRYYLRQRVFTDDALRHWLEGKLHPEIYQHMKQWAADCDAAYCVCVIPLLIESPVTFDFIDRVLVVAADRALCRERALQRDASEEKIIDAILKTQADSETQLANADDIVNNNKDVASLHAQLDALHERWR